MTTVRLLIVEDTAAGWGIRDILLEQGPATFLVESVSDLAEALSRLARGGVDVVLIDLDLSSDSHGLSSLTTLVQHAPDVAIIVLGGGESHELALAALRCGAQDCLPQGTTDPARLEQSIRFAMERKLAERRALSIRERYGAILRTAPDGFWLTDLQGTLLEVNDAYCQMSGYAEHELLSMHIAELEADESAEEVAWHLLRTVTEGKGRFESHHRRKDGTVFPVEIRVQYQAPDDGAIVVFIRDMSSQRRVEAEIIRERENLNAIFESSPVGLLLLDATTTIVRANAAAVALTEGSEAEFLQHRLGNALHCVHSAEDPRGCGYSAECPLCTMRYAIGAITASGDTMRPTELPLELLRNGVPTKVWMRVGAGSVIVDGVRHVLLSMSDITEHREAEEALRESEERFRRAVVDSPMPLLWHAEDGVVLQASNAWCEITGYRREELATIEDWTERAYGERKALVQADIEALYGLKHRTYEGDYAIRTKSGETRIWEFSSAPMGRMPDGRRTVVSMALDVTERRAAEEALKKFSLLAHNSSEFIGMCDLAMQPIYVNPAGLRMVGLPDMVAACQVMVQDYFFPEDQSGIAEDFFPRVLREGHGAVEIRLRHFQTGQPIWVLYSLFSLRDARGEVIGWATVSRDISERRQAEAVIEASLREKEALLKEVHHRVKNNLQVITSLLRLEGARSEVAETKTVLDEMKGRIRSMALLHEALNHSGTVAAVDLREYLAALAREVFAAHNTASSSVHLRLDLASVPAGMDQALPCGLILNELLANALEHGFPDGCSGEVLLELHAEEEGRRVRLRVSDSGMGLPADFATRQNDALGLQLVADLAGQLGGTLEIGSAPAAVFTVTFPANHK